MKTLTVDLTAINSYEKRLDASIHLSDGRLARQLLISSPYGLKKLRELSIDIFYGGRIRRIFVAGRTNGIPFLGSSDILKHENPNPKLISRSLTKDIDCKLIQPFWTLVTRSGTIGKTAFATASYNGKVASEDVIRIIPREKKLAGIIYAFLSTKYGYNLMTQGQFGGVITHVEPDYLAELPIPNFRKDLVQQIQNLMEECSTLRDEANLMLESLRKNLKTHLGLPDLNDQDYEHFGTHSSNREVSTFIKTSKEISALTINAFNYSKKINTIEDRVKEKSNWEPLVAVLNEKGFFSTGSFPRLEIRSPKSIKLINQSDIFDQKIEGKLIAKAKVKTDNLVEYGEVLIAGVGTLGENETFCRPTFANEEIEGQLVSGEFIRMQTNNTIPSGYLYCWLSTDYGFRLIRRTQTGTKLCRPIQKLLYNIPVPIVDDTKMKEIDSAVKLAHSKRNKARILEQEAISIIEKEIESWQK